MKVLVSVFFIAVLVFTLSPLGGVHATGWLYWTELDLKKIQGADYDGSNLRDVLTVNIGDPVDIELDMNALKIYWTNTATSAIRRCDFNGYNVEDVIVFGEAPKGIALDPVGGKIYWTAGSTSGTAVIMRADLDGSNVETLVAPFPRLREPYDIALDVAGGKMYWTDHGMFRVYRANLDGSDMDTLWAGAVDARGIAVDPGNGKFYYADQSGGVILRGNLDGTGLSSVVTGAAPHAIDLDLAAGKMYWTDTYYGNIYRANLDGTSEETIITGLDNPVGIALDSTGTSPTLLQHFTATGTLNGVELTWHLAEAGVGMEFYILRTQAGPDQYRELGEISVSNHGLTYRAVDRDCEPGVSYRYRVDVYDEGGRRTLFETQMIEVPAVSLSLGQNRPNPFNPATAIPYMLAGKERVTLSVYDTEGKLIKTLVDDVLNGGVKEAIWDGTDKRGKPVSSGVYFCRLKAGKKVLTRTMVLLR